MGELQAPGLGAGGVFIDLFQVYVENPSSKDWKYARHVLCHLVACLRTQLALGCCPGFLLSPPPQPFLSFGRLHPLPFCCVAEMCISRSEVNLPLGIPDERLTFPIFNLENSREKLGEAGSPDRRTKSSKR